MSDQQQMRYETPVRRGARIGLAGATRGITMTYELDDAFKRACHVGGSTTTRNRRAQPG